MGCGEAILVSDPALAGMDSLGAARVLAAAIRKIGDVTLALFGKQAIDGDMGVTAAQTARSLGWPVLSIVSVVQSLDPAVGMIRVGRSTEEGRQVVEAKLPVVMSVGKDIAEPRYPSFMGIRKAAKTEIVTWSGADIGLDPAITAKVTWPEVSNPPASTSQVEIIEGASLQDKADKLVEKLIADKVV